MVTEIKSHCFCVHDTTTAAAVEIFFPFLNEFGNSIHGSLPWQILYLPVMRLKKLQIRSKYWCFLALIKIFGRIYHKICHIMLRSSNSAALLRWPVMQGRRQSWLHKIHRLALLWLVYHKFLKEYHLHWLIKKYVNAKCKYH